VKASKLRDVLNEAIEVCGDAEVAVILPSLEDYIQELDEDEGLAGTLLDFRPQHTLDVVTPSGRFWLHLEAPKLD